MSLIPSSTDRHSTCAYKMHLWLLLWHEMCQCPAQRSSHNVTTHHLHQMCRRNVTKRGMEPCPTLVLTQSTDSELAKGGFSHIPHPLKLPPMLNTPKPIPQEYSHHAGSRAQGRTIRACEPCPSTQRDANTALTPQHVLLMFCCANQPADSFNTLAL